MLYSDISSVISVMICVSTLLVLSLYTSVCLSVCLFVCLSVRCHHPQCIVSEMTNTVSSGTLNSSIPYHTITHNATLTLLTAGQ